MQDDRHLLVIHGGPGLTSSYIREPLKRALPAITLRFFEQPYAGTALPKVDDFIAACIEALSPDLSGTHQTDVFCHSWGGLLFALALERQPTLADHIGSVIFANPLPLTLAGFQISQQRLFGRASPAEAATLGAMLGSDNLDDHSTALAQLYRYYSLRPTPPDFTPDYDHRVFTAIMTGLGAYDLTGTTALDRLRALCLFGEDDFIQPEDCTCLPASFQCETMPGVGHYPFIEQPTDLEKRVCNWLI